MKSRRRWILPTLAYLVVAVLAAIGVKSASHAGGQAKSAVQKIEVGRRAGTKVTCAISTAVIRAGRALIEESARQPLPVTLEAFLLPHGYPARKQREAGAEILGQVYTQRISQGIVAAVGVKGVKVLNHDGTVNCERLRKLARVR